MILPKEKGKRVISKTEYILSWNIGLIYISYVLNKIKQNILFI